MDVFLSVSGVWSVTDCPESDPRNVKSTTYRKGNLAVTNCMDSFMYVFFDYHIMLWKCKTNDWR